MITHVMGNARRLGVLLAVAATQVVTPARADLPDDAERLDVRVGQTVIVDVAFARGLNCDDLTVVAPDLRTHDDSANWFYVTGLRPGTTYCRVGTTDAVPSYVFRITVRR